MTTADTTDQVIETAMRTGHTRLPLVEHDGDLDRGITLDAPHETTLNGHLIEQLGRVPHPGETVELDGARLEVLAGDDSQISQVAVRSAPRPPHSTD